MSKRSRERSNHDANHSQASAPVQFEHRRPQLALLPVEPQRSKGGDPMSSSVSPITSNRTVGLILWTGYLNYTHGRPQAGAHSPLRWRPDAPMSATQLPLIFHYLPPVPLLFYVASIKPSQSGSYVS